MPQMKQKTRQLAFTLLQDFDIANQSRQFIKALMTFLQLDESKIYQKSIIAQKIAYIHELYRGQYDAYLTQQKFKQLYPEAKDFLWTVFKQYDERVNQLKHMNMGVGQQKGMLGGRDHLSPSVPTTNQNMSMNMVNMFMDVPNLQSIQEIQMFQRKMFQIYRNFLPQVLSSMPVSSSQSQYYRSTNPYQQTQQQYSMPAMNNMGMTGMAGMSVGAMNGIPGIQGLGMTSMTGLGMNAMNGVGGTGGMSGISSMGNMASMANMSNMNYGQKQSEYYESSPFSSRYFYDGSNQSQQQSSFSQLNSNPMKNPNPQIRAPTSMQGIGFNFCGDRVAPTIRQGQFQRHATNNNNKMPTSFSQNKISYFPQQFDRKSMSQKYVSSTNQQKYDVYHQSVSVNEYSQQQGLEKQSSKNSQKEKEKQFYINSELILSNNQQKNEKPVPDQPQKGNKDDQVSIFNEKGEQSRAQFLSCTCDERKEDDTCSYCRFFHFDPLNQVDKVLKIEKITPEKTTITYTVEKQILERINKNPDRLDIQIRCIKLQRQKEKQNENQICWPQRYRLLIDDDVIEDYSTPPQGNNAKKRKDKPCILSKHFGNDKNSQDSMKICLEIKKSEKSPSSTYILGIFVIVKHTIQKMYQKLINSMDEQNISSFFNEKSKEKKDEEQENQEEQAIIVSPFEPSIKKLIKDPIRGIYCTHPQCFDLQVYLSFLIISPNRQWKCPICGKEAKDFVIDNEQKVVLADIAKMIKEPQQIIYYANGAHVLKYEEKKESSVPANA